MPFDAASTFVAACSLALELGCASLQPIHQPPTPAEIDEINAPHAPIYVEALPTTGSGQHVWMVDHVVFADAEKIVVAPFAPVDGPLYAFSLYDVSNFHLRRTGHGAAIGAAWGAGIGLMVNLFGAFYVSRVGATGAPATPGDTSSGVPIGQVVELIVGSALGGGAIGALIGAIAGSPEDFPVVLGPAPPSSYPAPKLALAPPSSHPPPKLALAPPPMRAATVVAPSAEVRSAPFKVAPVVAVLTQGQRLHVDPTANAGWRIVFLSDGRVGYIQDAHVKTDSP